MSMLLKIRAMTLFSSSLSVSVGGAKHQIVCSLYPRPGGDVLRYLEVGVCYSLQCIQVRIILAGDGIAA